MLLNIPNTINIIAGKNDNIKNSIRALSYVALKNIA
jgi:hypothetical protein